MRGSPRVLVLAAGLVVPLVVAGIHVSRPALVTHADDRVYDLMLRRAERRPTSGRVVIVALDDRSLAEVGRWPWPRRRLASLITKILVAGAAVVALDMMFPEPDLAPTDDDALAQALRRHPVLIGYEFTFDPTETRRDDCALHPAPVTLARQGGAPTRVEPLAHASSLICSLPRIAEAAAGSGFLNAAPDADGLFRRIPLVAEYADRIYPSLALATLMQTPGTRPLVLATTPRGAQSLRLGEVAIPLDSRSHLLLSFRGPTGRFPYVSAADVLADRAPADLLRDKIVFVGVSALGLREAIATPVDPLFLGVEVHATVVDNVLRRDFVSRPETARAWELAMGLALGLISALVLARVRSLWSAPLVVVVGIGVWLAAGTLFWSTGLFLSPLLSTAMLAANFSVLTLLNFAIERRRADRTDQSLAEAKKLMLHTLTSLTEIRDSETGAHLLRTQHYTRLLCQTLASNPRLAALFTNDTIELLASLAPIHDIGKVGVPDRLLRKTGPLSAEEFELMKRHTVYGRDVIEKARARVGVEDEVLLRLAKDIVYCHHERWDGTGYPRGLKGEAIPMAGRVVALVDVYDALISERVYKEGLPHDEVVEMIVAGRGTQFDPDVVDAFLAVREEWRRIAREFGDHPAEPDTRADRTGAPASYP